MMQRRNFILGSTTLAALAAFGPLSSIGALAQTNVSVNSVKQKFSALHKKWVALYDSEGRYLTDIRLVQSTDILSDTRLEQFSLRWIIKGRSALDAGTYVIEDFTSEPMPIYLEPSYSKRLNGKFYRASISLLPN